MKKSILIGLFLTSLIHLSDAQDTFSICAIDTLTGEVGSAGASCVYISNQGVMILSDVHPGVGVIHSQASYNSTNQAYARSLMNLGLSPQQIIDSLVANDAQNNPSIRQYGVVDFRDGIPRSAAYTGVNCMDYKNHITGPSYSIQGNILLGQQILDSMEARFLRAEGELACRLMEALQGAKVVGADTRCLGDGISSIGSFLRVARPDDPVDDLYLQFNIPRADDGVDPIDSLQVLIDQWGGCNTTATLETKEKDFLRVFPNPAHDLIHFELNQELKSDETKLLIFNSMGQKIAEISFNQTLENDVQIKHFKEGLYTYQLIINKKVILHNKFIVR
jgi:uncharacterized Ntn-hydrolase superfamily protein